MPADSVRDFYDHLASEYHLIYADWPNAVRRQGAVLDRLIRSILGDGPQRVLDAACGIGTQAIGLALRGHEVVATDISAASVERAREEADTFGVKIDLGVADLRDLSSLGTDFDVVIACDNALPHLVKETDLSRAAANMAARLRPRGILITSIRDYDAVAKDRPAATTPEVFEHGKRVVFQTWDWARDGRTYTLNLFIARAEGDAWTLAHHATRYRALARQDLATVLKTAGLTSVRWHTPAETGFFQQICTARA